MAQYKGTRRQRLIGMGFVIAFVLSTATIIYTGLNVRAPGSHRNQQGEASTVDAAAEAAPPARSHKADEPRESR